MSVFMQPIYTQTMGAVGAQSVTFNNIPQGFTDLVLEVSGRGTDPTQIFTDAILSFNGETPVYGVPSNSGQQTYPNLWFQGQGSGNAGPGSANPGTIGTLNGPANVANSFGVVRARITGYSSGTYKTILSYSVSEDAAATAFQMGFVTTWMNSSPITSITITSNASAKNNWAQYSTFTLYGVSDLFAGGAPTAPTLGTVTDQAGFASVSFTPAANDQAISYQVTSSPSGSTAYGYTSPIVAPATLGTSYTYQVSAVNDKGTSASSSSSAITTNNSYTSIATMNLSGGSLSATYTFTSIPQNYSHLQVRCFVRSLNASTTDMFGLYFNNDATSGVYYLHALTGNGSSITSGQTSNNQITTYGFPPVGNSATSGVFSAYIIDIPDYANNMKARNVKIFGGTDLNGSGTIGNMSGSYSGYAPISSITFNTNAGFAQYSHIALYGIA
jgi:hypothetical protein